MSDRPSLRLSRLARVGLIATSLVGSLTLGGGSFAAVAQDATPTAECVPGTMSMAMDMATPEMDMATPAAEVAEPVGAPADEMTTAAAQAFVANAIACIDDPEALATIVTSELVANNGGYASIEDAIADGFFSDLAFGEAEIGDVTSYDDGSVGIELTYMQSEFQLLGEEWLLVDEAGTWKLNGFNYFSVSPDGDTAAVGVVLGENEDGTYFIAPNTPSVVVTDVIILQAINTGVEAHELVVVQLPEGADPAGILDGSISEEDVLFVGFVDVSEPGSSTDMTLVGLPVGVYTLLCFYPDANGEPHAFHGMIAPFEVTAPAE